MNHERHIQLIAWFHIIVGVLSLVFLFFVFSAGLIFGLFSRLFLDTAFAPILFTFFMLYLLIGALPALIVGKGLLDRKSWARYAGIILALFSILNFPIGTALSVYTIWALWSRDASEYFAPRYISAYAYERY